ncbi:MAG: hypothetical protein ACYDA9_09450 [Terriglobia bacterium]
MNRILQERAKRTTEEMVAWAGAAMFVVGCSSLAPAAFCAGGQSPAPRSGVFTDYREEKSGVVHKIPVKDLPHPYATKSDDGTESVWRVSYAGKSR